MTVITSPKNSSTRKEKISTKHSEQTPKNIRSDVSNQHCDEENGYKNKYTYPICAEATTDEYLVEIQTIKKITTKKPKRLN